MERRQNHEPYSAVVACGSKPGSHGRPGKPTARLIGGSRNRLDVKVLEWSLTRISAPSPLVTFDKPKPPLAPSVSSPSQSSSGSSRGADDTDDTLHRCTMQSELPLSNSWSWNRLYLTVLTLWATAVASRKRSSRKLHYSPRVQSITRPDHARRGRHCSYSGSMS